MEIIYVVEGIIRVQMVVEANCALDWSNKQMAAMLSISQEYLIKLFQKMVGQSPQRFVRNVRHSDLHYFSRQFSKLEGIPPSDYRKLSHII